MLVETLSDLGEADAALAAAREVAPHLPVVVTHGFDTNLRTMMGVRPADAAAHLAAAGADAVGRQLRPRPAGDGGHRRGDDGSAARGAVARRAVQRRPPAGGGDHFEYDASAGDMAAHTARLADLGVDLVGGCCGSTPSHIAAMGALLAA